MIFESINIVYGSQRIECELHWRERKSLGIRVYPDLTVRAYAPIGTAKEKVTLKVKEKAAWIIKQKSAFLSFHPLTPPRLYVNGETHLYLGKQYRLRVIEGTDNSVKLKQGWLIVTKKQKDTAENVLNEWYRERANQHFAKLLKECIQKFRRYQLNMPELSILSMPTRWGSCTPKGKVILNPELIKARKGCIEYVIIHELCHLIEHNHTRAFYKIQSEINPEWAKWKELLESQLV